MRYRMRSTGARCGGALLELAAVAIVFFLLLFGIMEYCRLIFTQQVVENAAREGARYAVANTMSPTLDNDTQTLVNQRMVGVNKTVGGYNVQVFEADQNGNKIGLASDAPFGTYIAVQIDCDFEPVLPQFLFFGRNIHVKTKAVMYSEAN